MLTQDWLTDAVLYTYALSLLFFMSDAATGNRTAKKAGTGLLVFVWLLQTAFLLTLLFGKLSDPTLLLREYLLFVSWLLVSVSFLVHRWQRAELLVLLVNVVGFAVLALNLLQRPHKAIELAPWEVMRKLLVLHVSLITVAFAILTVAAVLGGMYLFLHAGLKKKRWNRLMSRMPSLELIDRYAFRAGLVGVTLLLLSLSTGTAALLMEDEGGPGMLLDGKVLLSFAAGILYIVYLVRRTSSADDGSRLARWNLAGYVALVANFFADSLSAFHNWV